MTSPKRLALYTFGVFRGRADDLSNRGFHARNDINFAAAERAEGFLARSGYDDDPGPESWGEHVYPRFYVEKGDGHSPSTLSLWSDLESPVAFSYSGVHAEALKHGHRWFVRPQWPPYAAWWVAADDTPTWREAVERHEYLHQNGPTARVFDFKKPFGPDGEPAVIDRDRVKEAAKRNEVRSGSVPSLDGCKVAGG